MMSIGLPFSLFGMSYLILIIELCCSHQRMWDGFPLLFSERIYIKLALILKCVIEFISETIWAEFVFWKSY